MKKIILFSLFFLIFGSLGIAKEQEKKTKEKAPTTSELIREFKKVKEASARTELVDQILKGDEKAAKSLHSTLGMSQLLKSYEKKLQSEANKVYKKQVAKNKSNIAKQRKILKELREKKKLQKQDIIDKGDPALKSLKEYLFVSADSAHNNSKTLMSLYTKISEYKSYHNKCLQVMKKEHEDIDAVLKSFKKHITTYPLLNDKAHSKVMAFNAKLKESCDTIDYEGMIDLNIYRILVGVPALKIDVKLHKCCVAHSKDMVKHNYFSHTGKNGSRFTQRAKKHGTKAGGENIHYGSTDGKGANKGWFHSPGHHKNMLNEKFSFQGLGHAETKWTQMFR